MYENLSPAIKHQLFFHNLHEICNSLINSPDITLTLGELLKHLADFFDNKNANFYLVNNGKAYSISSIEERTDIEINISDEDEKKLISNHFALEEAELSFYPSLERLNNSKVKLLIPLSYNNTLIGLITLGQKRENNTYYDNIFTSMIANFISRILYYSNYFSDKKDKSSEEAYLKNIIDGLSGVYIKSYIEQRMIEGMKEAKRYKHSDSFCLVRIDNFDNIKLKYGQQITNIVIQETGETINNFLRKDVDFVGKHSEESFLILLPSTNFKGAVIFAEKLQLTLLRMEFKKYIEEDVTVSIGVTTLENKDRNKEDIFKKLYEAISNSEKLGGGEISLNYHGVTAGDLSSFEKASGVSAELLKESIEHPVFLVDENGNEIDFTANVHKNWLNIPKNYS